VSELIGLESRFGRVVRRGNDFVFTHPFTGETIVVSPVDYTPEMKSEMQEHIRKVEAANEPTNYECPRCA